VTALQLSPAASWGLILALVCAVLQAVLWMQRHDIRRWERYDRSLDDDVIGDRYKRPGWRP
jgi:uncharacterized membrane protein